MTNTLLTIDWNADPNSPEVTLTVENTTVILVFYINYFLYERFQEGDKARLTFLNCQKFSFNTMNDEGYFLGQYRYKHNELPWGEFYKIETNWKVDFPTKHTILMGNPNHKNQSHFIFFFKDNTFECVSEEYHLEFYRDK